MEIRQRNDEIEKKMYRVDRLNRKLETLNVDVEDEAAGPLEATIKQLEKARDAAQQECTDFQREWLTKQTALVECSAEKESVTESVQELKGRVAITQQKRMRLLKAIEQAEAGQRELQNGMSQMRTDMAKLNELQSKHTGQHSELVDKNYALEMEFVAELKEMEAESARLERYVADVKLQKKSL